VEKVTGLRRLTVLFVVLALNTPVFARPPADEPGPVEVQMRNIVYHFTPAIAVHIRYLHGHLIADGVPVFDDKNSFQLEVGSAEMAMPLASLTNVLNDVVLASDKAPLKAVSLSVGAKGVLKVKGKLHRKGDIPFESEGALTATPDGKIKLHVEKVKALHLPVKGMMDLLGVEVSDLVNTGKVTGMKAEKDDLILDPETLLPPPHIRGKVTAVRMEAGNVVLGLGKGIEMPMRVSPANYMAYRGHQLRFGKLTMSDTDMVLIDMDPKDPFDFYLDGYMQQLVAGYTKETASFGLRVYMRDYNKLPTQNRKQRAGRSN
jgi:hypothetical protein